MRRDEGFSIIELVFVSFLASMLFLALVLGITGMGYSQIKSERLFTVDMVFTDLVATASEQPYDELQELSGTRKVKLNGFEFQSDTEVVLVDSPPGLQKVQVTLSWEDRNGRHSRSRSVLRAKPR